MNERPDLARDLDESDDAAATIDRLIEEAAIPQPPDQGTPGNRSNQNQGPTEMIDTPRDEGDPWVAWLATPPRPEVLGELAPPPFPIDSLPDWMADTVRAIAASTATRLDVAGALSLAVASTAAVLGPRKPRVIVDWNGLRGPLNLYVLVIEESGSGKSPAHNLVMQPLVEIERGLIEADRESYAERAASRCIAEAALDRATKALRSPRKPVPGSDAASALRGDFEQATADLEKTPTATSPQIIASDATPEAIPALLADNPVVCLATSEGDEIIAQAMGRYSKAPIMEPLLKAWDGESLRVNRRSREPLIVEGPTLTVACATQPVTLTSSANSDNGRAADRGLIGRFLIAWPLTVRGHRSPPTGTGMSDEAKRVWRDGIWRLYETQPQGGEGDDYVRLTLSDDAKAVAAAFYVETEVAMSDGEALDWCGSMVSKMRSHMLRLAGVLHLVEGFDLGTPIGADTMGRAVDFCHYFLAMALRAWRVMLTGPEAIKAIVWRRLLAKAKQSPFTDEWGEAIHGLTQRDLHRTLQRKLKIDGLREVLAELEQAGLVWAAKADPDASSRNASPWVLIHPDAK